MKANNGSIVATIIICAVLLAGFGYMMVPEVPAVPTAAEIALAVNIPTAAEVAALISVPEAPVVDTGMVDRICELTDGCEFYEIDANIYSSGHAINFIDGHVVDSLIMTPEIVKDFSKAFGDLVGLEWDSVLADSEIELVEGEILDIQVRAYSENDKDDGNYEVKAYMKVLYEDTDEYYALTESDGEYILVTTNLDEGEYDSLSIKKVDRRFEFN